ncbi:DUF3320 domain-containing protein [Pseudoduganella armeniaca]|uniref:DUF3320 domain-containing protein n=1 Tax=Pseudoduganella armeniaca TaxID=2072590 RepID=A0A2R4C7R3_9BURK|nr:DUF3320 domain-containing protein [Pseudoduganella armeniaca]AVR95663.1 DUF3320 domain-containing protein [Pseudoduganella armeniaca]
MTTTIEDGVQQPGLQRLFDDTRRRLVETGTRNRLVHVNRANTRGNVVAIVNERADETYALLAAGKALRFRPLGRDVDDAAADAVRLADVGEEGFDPERQRDGWLETRLGPDALQKRLLKIAREARTAEEESGVNVLYLALGFLTWLEQKPGAPAREAPLVLLPVELVRNARTSTYDLRLRDEDVVTNLPLQQRLKEDFGIVLPELDIEEGWTPAAYFAQVEAVVAERAGWRVERDAMQLGFFSFSKLLMYRDLAPDAWPDGAIAGHALTRGLLYEGFTPAAPLAGPADRLDEVLPTARICHVVDADASQAVVIEEARLGRNLVVQGPPGTGKSQTIANIIAAAVHDGKRVLFVAEKMAALSVVHERLVKAGLRDVCLELHSRNANKKAVLAELARTLSAAADVPSMPAPPDALAQAVAASNAIAEVLHRPIGASGETAFSVLALQARLIGQGVPAPTIDGAAVAALAPAALEQLLAHVARFGALLAAEGAFDAHPFAGTRNLDLQPVQLTRLAPLLEQAAQAAEALAQALQAAAGTLGIALPPTRSASQPLAGTLAVLRGLPPDGHAVAARLLACADLPRLRQTLAAGLAWRAAHDAAAATFVDAAFGTAAPLHLRAPLLAGTGSFFTRWGGAYRGASRELAGLLRGALPKRAAERVALVDTLLDVHARREHWQADEPFAAAALGDAWRAGQTDFGRLLALADWCAAAQAAPLRLAPDRMLAVASQPAQVDALLIAIATAERGMAPLDEVLATLDADFGADYRLDDAARRLRRMALALPRYGGWVALRQAYRALTDDGVPEVARHMRDGTLAADAAAVEIRFARAEHLWNVAREAEPVLRELGGQDRHALAARFAALERQHLKDNVTAIVARHLAQVPQGAMGNMKVVRGEIGKKRGHMALRKLFASAGDALQRIKPVMLMSPISVAQFVPPGALEFDLLIIDEASQVRPEDALGAIARARQIVVVGDQKQLPPSSFFDRLLSDEAEDEAEETEADAGLLGSAASVGALESVLSLCEARGLSGRMLQWHYRSRDPSLIRVSNAEFYGDGLVLPPSPLERNPGFGLCFTRVPGVYDKGGKRDNRVEGDAIVARVAEHARSQAALSLGIVTFSSSQRNLITELLELARRADPVLDAFLREGKSEDVFVKNIENVQGDERDVILVSVGYGPTEAGGRLASMAFGPVNAEGGERRLNVLFTRARLRCEVFASFDPADIDPARTSRAGPRILKRFLQAAQQRGAADAPAAGAPSTVLAQDVADAIRALGYVVDAQVGSAGFYLDLAVRHPDRPDTYLLAVECDGPAWRDARWARERERLRQEVLAHLGWRLHRVWSTDWFYRRDSEIERLRAALDAARGMAPDAPPIDGANSGMALPIPVDEPELAVEAAPVAAMPQMPLYERCVVPMGEGEPHELAPARLVELVTTIVTAEGPIHVEEVARRVAACFGKDKAGARILALTRTALETADLLSDGTFWFTQAQHDAPPLRDRSQESGATVKAASISPLELGAALRLAREQNGGGSAAEMIRCAARLLGFKRVGTELSERLAAALES